MGVTMDEQELNAWVDTVVNQFRGMNFVDRIAQPEQWPTIPLGNDMVGSHLMMWGEIGPDRTPAVFPSIIWDPATKELRQLDPLTAQVFAERSGQFIPFPDANSADLFSREYKRHWRKK